MSGQVSKRFAVAALLCSAVSLTLAGCGNPDGVQENPYAAPAEPAAEGGSGNATEETPAAAEAGSSNTTE